MLELKIAPGAILWSGPFSAATFFQLFKLLLLYFRVESIEAKVFPKIQTVALFEVERAHNQTWLLSQLSKLTLSHV